jgi:hypothetical protein
MITTSDLFALLAGPSLAARLIRGAISIAMFASGLGLSYGHPYLGVPLMLLALVPIGGCPACWLGGVIGAACEVKRPNQRPE